MNNGSIFECRLLLSPVSVSTLKVLYRSKFSLKYRKIESENALELRFKKKICKSREFKSYYGSDLFQLKGKFEMVMRRNRIHGIENPRKGYVRII